MSAPSPKPAPTPYAEHDPRVGTTIGNQYRLVRRLGAGGMGIVYEAKHLRLPRRAAVKILQPDIAKDPISLERFQREAQTASALGSRHIVQVTDLNTLPDGSPYIVMDFLEGMDLGTAVEQRGPFAPVQAAKVLEQLVAALKLAHQHGIVHRDIKPANIFLAREPDGEEVVKVLDFGLCKVRSAQRSLTGRHVVGTPWYMAPEQMRSSRDVDARADVYAVGVVAYELLTGRVPFDAENVLQVMDQVLRRPFPSLRDLRPELPTAVDAVIQRTTAKDPEQRYPTVRDLWSALAPALGAELRTTGPTVIPDGESLGSGLEPTAPARISSLPHSARQTIVTTGEEDTAISPKRPARATSLDAAPARSGNRLVLAAAIATLVVVAGLIAGWLLLRHGGEPATVVPAPPTEAQPPPTVETRPAPPPPALPPTPKAEPPPQVDAPVPPAPRADAPPQVEAPPKLEPPRAKKPPRPHGARARPEEPPPPQPADDLPAKTL